MLRVVEASLCLSAGGKDFVAKEKPSQRHRELASLSSSRVPFIKRNYGRKSIKL